jgi:16S rRNA (adenine1518-N6/adenine1519-N6)-dimethyltransferase
MKGLRPIKKLGQHFLVDPSVIARILGEASLNPKVPVVEIGPGRGALTLPLARSVDHLLAVEKDSRLSSLLKKKLVKEGIDNVTIFNEDILKWDFNEIGLADHSEIQVIGNLPYNITSPVIEKLIKNRGIISRAILMFQKEVANRLTASPRKKEYGALTVLLRYYALSRPLINVQRKSFYPVPKVDSVVLELDFKKPYVNHTVNEVEFKKVVKAAFSHRRKTLLNSFAKSPYSYGNPMKLKEALLKCGIDPSRRAETLDMDEFICLTGALKLTGTHLNGKG